MKNRNTNISYPAISRAFLRQFLVARWSKRPNTDFGRTTVKTTIYSHDGQNDRILIFDHAEAKMCEISRRDTFKTTDVMFQSKIHSPEQKFGNLTHFVAPQHAIPASSRTAVKKTEPKFSANGRAKCVKITGAKHSGPLPSSSGEKYSLQWKTLEI